ncbi:MAG: 50S ribosomal protein L13 [Oscillospiraceae bacterium]|nr:50S ribosomal protein L13 [Oscillospiraceae bacterium]
MSTTMARKENVTREWLILDAAGVSLGHTAAKAATLLRGKHKPEYTPHVDVGDFVIIINASQAVLTGKKPEQKIYYRHSGYVGGLKATKYRLLMEKNSPLAMRLAVKGMMPRNALSHKALTRLRIFADATHTHEAQQPVLYAGGAK